MNETDFLLLEFLCIVLVFGIFGFGASCLSYANRLLKVTLEKSELTAQLGDLRLTYAKRGKSIAELGQLLSKRKDELRARGARIAALEAENKRLTKKYCLAEAADVSEEITVTQPLTTVFTQGAENAPNSVIFAETAEKGITLLPDSVD